MTPPPPPQKIIPQLPLFLLSQHLLQPDELAQLRTESGGALLSDHLALAIGESPPQKNHLGGEDKTPGGGRNP